MENGDYDKVKSIIEDGDLFDLPAILAPYLKDGDLDARYFSCCFSVDEEETGEEFDQRAQAELVLLCKEFYPDAMFEYGYLLRIGADIERDEHQGFNLILCAALLGNTRAKEMLALEMEEELDSAGLRDRIMARR